MFSERTLLPAFEVSFVFFHGKNGLLAREANSHRNVMVCVPNPFQTHKILKIGFAKGKEKTCTTGFRVTNKSFSISTCLLFVQRDLHGGDY